MWAETGLRDVRLRRSGCVPAQTRHGVFDGLRQIAATGDYSPMHGVIGRVSPEYLRDPLIKTHGEPPGAGSHVCIREGIEEGRIGLRKRPFQPTEKSALAGLEPGARVMRDKLTHSLRIVLTLQEPATVQRAHPNPDEPR